MGAYKARIADKVLKEKLKAKGAVLIETFRLINPLYFFLHSKMVLTSLTPYAYKRPDGITIVPSGCLKP